MMVKESSSAELRIFAPAKINWALTIRGRRPDGFHDLDTIFQTLAWGDELVCRPLARRECRIACDWPEVPRDESNLVWRAWRLLADTDPRVGGLSVRLLKRIPAGAGLGGGSSDAAAALVALNRLYGLRLGATALERLAAQLGSDCAFFIRGGTALGTGRGEILEPVRNRLPPLWLVLVWPGFPSATAAAYRRVTPADYEDMRRVARVKCLIEKGDTTNLKKSCINRFSPLVSDPDVRYKNLQYDITAEALEFPSLSGSGSAMFAFANDREHAHQAVKRLGKIYPVAVAVKLRHRGVGPIGK